MEKLLNCEILILQIKSPMKDINFKLIIINIEKSKLGHS